MSDCAVGPRQLHFLWSSHIVSERWVSVEHRCVDRKGSRVTGISGHYVDRVTRRISDTAAYGIHGDSVLASMWSVSSWPANIAWLG